MMWNIFILLISFIMDLAETKHCPYFEVTGETRFYKCARTEYCCSYGCCFPSAFQFYQLWYYWLLVIFMFLLCSGGGWWYRCWLRSRFPETTTSITPRTTSHSPGLATRRSTLIRSTRSVPPSVPAAINCTAPDSHATLMPQGQFQVARVSYSTSGERLILHRLWKDARGDLHHLDSPPSYTTARADAQPGGLDLAAATTVLMNPYVLYGPPPSYDSVIQQDQAGPSGTQTEAPQLEVSSPSPVEECSSSLGSLQPSPMTPTSPVSPQEMSSAASPTSPGADITSDEDRGPPTSHQASQTVFSPIVSPTNPTPL